MPACRAQGPTKSGMAGAWAKKEAEDPAESPDLPHRAAALCPSLRQVPLRKSNFLFSINHHAKPHHELTCRLPRPGDTSCLALTLNSQDESEVEKEARSPPQAQEKKDESQIVSLGATSPRELPDQALTAPPANKRPTLLDLN